MRSPWRRPVGRDGLRDVSSHRHRQGVHVGQTQYCCGCKHTGRPQDFTGRMDRHQTPSEIRRPSEGAAVSAADWVANLQAQPVDGDPERARRRDEGRHQGRWKQIRIAEGTTAGLRIAVATSTRGYSIAFAATAPNARAIHFPGSVRLVRANVNVTFVDDTRPPSKPVTRYP